MSDLKMSLLAALVGALAALVVGIVVAATWNPWS